MRPRVKPKQIILSKRANVFYLEHVRVMQKDDRVVYLTWDGGDVERFFNVPERNTAFILLGKGSSITDAAARKLADSNVVLGFVGNGGSPLFSSVDHVFLSPQSEYRPTEYMQAWARMWFDEGARLDVAGFFFSERLVWAQRLWNANLQLQQQNITIPDEMVSRYSAKAVTVGNVGQLLSIEAGWAKELYAKVASGYSLRNFRREEGKKSKATLEDVANSFLDHGNYIAYGYSAAALNVLGISFAFPVMHGKTRRGGLVFDVADLFKDGYVLPLAFHCASNGYRDQEFRDALIEACYTDGVLDMVIKTIKKVAAKYG